MSLKQSIEILMQGKNLSADLCYAAIKEMFGPRAHPVQISAFLVLLRRKKETVEELLAMLMVLNEQCVPLHMPYDVLDIVGTGGDGEQTVNISTGAAILAASCGVKIAKHGNRSVSSICGSADVLEALGINISLNAEQVSRCIDQVGIGFCYSPLFHPLMQHLRDLRKQLGVPTAFNGLGPLLNPASAPYLLMGVADIEQQTMMAAVLAKKNVKQAWVVHGTGLDEISCLGPIRLIEVQSGHQGFSYLDPKNLGLNYCTLNDLKGGDPKTNAQRLLKVFKGEKGGLSDTIALNAGVALYLYGAYNSIQEGLNCAQHHLRSGQAFTLLNLWKELSHDV